MEHRVIGTEGVIWQGDDVLETISNLIIFIADREPDPCLIKLLRCLHYDIQHQSSRRQHRFEMLLDWLWDRLHDDHWTRVNNAYRLAFGIVSAVKIQSALVHHEDSASFESLFGILDLGILLGSPVSHNTLIDLAARLRARDSTQLKLNMPCIPSGVWNPVALPRTIPPTDARLRSAIPVLECVDVLQFYTEFLLKSRPVLIKHGCDDWPAISRWKKLSYISEVAGRRTVPVETGHTYLSSSSGQKLMTIDEFICRYVLPLGQTVITPSQQAHNTVGSDMCGTEDGAPGAHSKKRARGTPSSDKQTCGDETMAYIAQHALFDQVPELRQDFFVPDFCALLHPEEEESDAGGSGLSGGVVVNAWFGPIGTVSPLHHDPYHNILAQVHGCKYVRLYAPTESVKLYPLTGGSMGNNSAVDFMDVDSTRLKHPLALSAPYMDVVLRPGDMLHIPRWWWHYVSAVAPPLADDWDRQHSNLQGKADTEKASSTGTLPEEATVVNVDDCVSWSVNFWWGDRKIKS